MLPNRHKDRTDPCYSRGQRIGVIHLAHWSMSTLTSNNLKIYPLPSTLMAQLIARLTSTLWNRVQISQWLFNYFGLPNNSYMYTFRNILRFETQPFWRITCNIFLLYVSYKITLWNPTVLKSTNCMLSPDRFVPEYVVKPTRFAIQPLWSRPWWNPTVLDPTVLQQTVVKFSR